MIQGTNRRTVKYQVMSFKYAFWGLGHFYKTEAKAIIHTSAAIIAVVFGILFHISSIEWLLIVFSIGLVIFAEVFNTAIERITDLVSPDHHPLAGQAKDLAAGAVMVVSIISVIVGALIFLPKIFYFFNSADYV